MLYEPRARGRSLVWMIKETATAGNKCSLRDTERREAEEGKESLCIGAGAAVTACELARDDHRRRCRPRRRGRDQLHRGGSPTSHD